MIRISNKNSTVFKKFMVFLGILGTVFYPILFAPYFDPEKYKDMQKEARRNINRKDIQPGNMNIWSDPFAPKKGETESAKET